MPSHSITPEQIYGTWRLISAQAIDAEGQSLQPPYGPTPMGRIVFNREGRMMAVICDGRPTIPQGGTRAYASYCGNFRIEHNFLITRVDAALEKERIGGEQRRRIELRGDQLVLIPPPRSDGEQRELVWMLDGSP